MAANSSHSSQDIYVSIVIPVYNEEDVLETLFDRLMPVMDKLEKPFEVIFTNDGSRDRSSEILKSFHKKRPHQVRIIEFNGNFGQHMAIMAAFEITRGEIVINLDADLQNPPEEIPRFVKKYEEGYDYIGSIRDHRKDNYFLRSLPSKFMNWLRGKITDIHITDQGCMMRAYSRRIVNLMKQCYEPSTFITALGYSFAVNPTELVIRHDARELGDSKYDAYRLIRVSFDLFTGFSMAPLQVFTVFGFLVSALSGILVLYMLGRRLIIGPEAEGVFTLFAILFFLVSVAITGIGIVGEYIGRIYQVVRKRPRYLIREIVETLEEEESPKTLKKVK